MVWSFTNVSLIPEITCRPLPEVRDGSIHPPTCTANDVAFGTTCTVTCHSGYTLIGPHSKQCLPEGIWTPPSESIQCDGKRLINKCMH